jgi:hypothetical protein
MSTPLTDTDALILNAARGILKMQAEGYPDDYGASRVVTLAGEAEQAIFNYLNNASTWGKNPAAYRAIHPGEALPDRLVEHVAAEDF